MTALLYLLGVVVFVVAILVSIGLHELGHMIPAKAFGGKVTQYFIGFGPTVWSKQVGETEYGFKAVPLGGYVKIVGMLPPGADDLGEVEYDEHGERVLRVRKSNTGMFTQLISDARAAEWEHVKPRRRGPAVLPDVVVEEGRRDGGRPDGQHRDRVLPVLGCLQHLRQLEEPVITPVVSDVLDCVVPYTEDGRACTAAGPGDAGQGGGAAGRRPVRGRQRGAGDELGRAPGPDPRQRRRRGHPRGRARRRGAHRHDQHRRSTARPISEDPTDETLTEVGFLGVQPTVDGLQTGGPLYTVEQMGHMTVRTVEALATLPIKVWGVAKAIVGVEERAVDSPVSIVGGGRIAGETASTDLIPSTDKVVFLAMLVAGFNFFIGMFNFIPLLPLDGGHIAGALYEAVRRGFARLRRLPDPGYVDVARLLPWRTSSRRSCS